MSSKKVSRGIYLTLDGTQVKNSVKGIQAELRKVQSEQRLATIGSKQYVAAGRKVSQLKVILADHNAQLARTQRQMQSNKMTMSSMVDGYNKYMGVVLGAIGALTGLVIMLRKARDEYFKINAAQHELQALTGLHNNDIEWFTQQAKKLATTMDETGLRVTESVADILQAYKLVGSAKPELLKNRDALHALTVEAMRLSQAAGSDINFETAVKALTAALNQFSASEKEASRYVNAIAAGSQRGAGNIDYISKVIIKAGASADQANVSIEEMIGLIETLAQKKIPADIAGTSLRNIFIALSSGADEFNPKVVGLDRALYNLSRRQMSTAEMVDMFTKRAYQQASIIVNNTGLVKKYTKAVSGTEVAYEQARINSAKMESIHQQRINQYKIIWAELGQSLKPVLTMTTSILMAGARSLPVLIKFIGKYGTELLALITVITAYNTALKLSILYTQGNVVAVKAWRLSCMATKAILALLRGETVLYQFTMYELRKEFGLMTLWTKISTAAQIVWRNSMILGKGIIFALSGNITKATQAMRIFTAATGINPFVIITTAVVSLIALLIVLQKQYKDTAKAQDLKRSVSDDAAKATRKEIAEFETLWGIAKDNRIAIEERQKAMENLQKIAPDYLSNIDLETINTNKATIAKREYIKELNKEAKLKAAQDMIQKRTSEYLAKKAEAQKRLKELEAANPNARDYVGFGIKAAIYNPLYAFQTTSSKTFGELAEVQRQQLKEMEDNYNEYVKRVRGIIADDTYHGGEMARIKIIRTKLEKLNKDMQNLSDSYGSLEEKKPLRNMEIPKALQIFDADSTWPAWARKTFFDLQDEADNLTTTLNKLDKRVNYKKGKDKKQKVHSTPEQNEIQHQKNIRRIKKKYLDGEYKDKKEYLKAMASEEFQYLKKQVNAYGISTEEREKFEDELLENRIKFMEGNKGRQDSYWEQREKKSRIKIDKEYLEGKIRTQEEYNLKIKKLEVDMLKQRIKFGKDELSQKKKLQDQLLTAQIQYENQRTKVDDDAAKKKRTQEVNDIDFFAQLEVQKATERYMKGETTEKQYQSKLREIALDAIAEKLEDQNISDKERNKLEGQAQNIRLQQFEVSQKKITDKAKQNIELLGDVGTALGESLGNFISGNEGALKDFASNTIQLALDTLEKIVMLSIAESTAKSIASGPMGWLTAAAKIMAIRMAFATAKAAVSNFYTGGYTGSGRWNEAKGFVHSDEFVVNRFGVANPAIRKVTDLVDLAQRQGTVRNLTGDDIAAVVAGSHPTATQATRSTQAGSSSASYQAEILTQSELQQALIILLQSHKKATEKLTEKLEKPIEARTYVTGKGGSQQAQSLLDKMNKNASRKK